MNYFFLPNVPPLRSRVTLCNFSPEGTSGGPLRVYAARAGGGVWDLFPLGKLAAGTSRTFSSDDLPAEAKGDKTVFLFLHPDPLPKSTPELFVTDFLNTEPAWRGNIQLVSDASAASYQGDYPDAMLGIARGTLVSLSPLVQASTKLIFTNLQRAPVLEKRRMVAAGLRSRKVLAEFRVTTNSCNVIDLSGIPSTPEDPLCLFSKEITGIPLYLSHDPDFRRMSLEHSHPPAELLVFGPDDARRPLIANMKKWWLQNVSGL